MDLPDSDWSDFSWRRGVDSSSLCNMHALDQVRFCIYFALNFVDEAAIMEQYGNEVGLAALEWCDVFDSEYRRTTWIADEEWFTDVTSLVVDKWTSPCP